MSNGWKQLPAAAALSLALLGMGCSFELPGGGAPPRMYILSPKSTFPKNLPTVDWQLLIETPLSPAGINTQRIALRLTDVRLLTFEITKFRSSALPMITASRLLKSCATPPVN